MAKQRKVTISETKIQDIMKVKGPGACRQGYHFFSSYLWILVNMAATSYVGLHRFCNISKHSSPVLYTFGWNIWLMNLTPGGLFGYCSSKCMTSRKVPSSNGVSAGPMMTAFLYRTHKRDLSGKFPSCVDLKRAGQRFHCHRSRLRRWLDWGGGEKGGIEGAGVKGENALYTMSLRYRR